MKQRIIPIVLTSILLGLVFNWFFVAKLPGISVLLYTALILGYTFYLSWQFRHRLSRSIYWLAPVILFFSLMIFVRANLFLAFMNICIILYLLLLVVRLGHQPAVSLRQYDAVQYFNPIIGTPFRIVGEFLRVIYMSLSDRATKKSKQSYTPVIRGIILSLPILFIFVMLLSSADLVFKQYVGSLLDFNVSPETVFRWSLIGFVSSLFTGAYALIFMPSSRSESPGLDSKKVEVGSTEASIVLGSVSLLFFIFVIVQLAYFFGGSGQVASAGFTYAEYARKGFFELIAVAAISLMLVGAIKKYSVFRTVSEARIFKWLSGVLIAEVVIIMFSAHMRLSLYENAYGFTTLRLLSHLFILWLAYAFGQLLYHIVKQKDDNSFALHLFISALCFFALINLINPDNFIARQNIKRFNNVGKIDLYYLGSLSEDAVPVVAKLLDHPNAGLQKGAANILYDQKRYGTNQPSHWQSANIARQRANQIFQGKAVQIDSGESYREYREFGTE